MQAIAEHPRGVGEGTVFIVDLRLLDIPRHSIASAKTIEVGRSVSSEISVTGRRQSTQILTL